MSHHNYQDQLKSLWDKALHTYNQGNRDPQSYFDKEDTEILMSIGMNAQEIFDFVDDSVRYEIPGFFLTMLLVQDVRRSYFLEVQKGEHSDKLISVDELPAKTEEVNEIPWLPRIIKKAQAKLRGEMPPELMYGCGGDRKFFKTNNVHPAEFLRIVWQAGDDEAFVVDWVNHRRNNKKPSLLKRIFPFIN